MIHIPGVYSGGETAGGHKWTQTKGEVELRVPLPEGAADGAVRCEIEPRALRLSAGGLELSGELDAVVVVADSLWSVDTDGAAKTAVVSLRKAVAGLWTRLLVTDAEAAEAPRLLDGLERTAPRSKAELLKDAKGRAKASLDGPSKAKTHTIEGRVGETLTVSAAELPELPVLVLRGCRECRVAIPAEVSAVKVQVEGCSQLTLAIDGKVLTETLELYKCDGCAVELRSKLATVQLDACSDLTLRYARREHFDRVFSADVHRVRIEAGPDAPAASVDFAALQAEMPSKELDRTTDQFVTRALGGVLTTELVIRLGNDFPTTEREVEEYAARTRLHASKLDEVVEGMLGSALGHKLSDAEKDQMKEMVRKQADEASAAQCHAEQTASGRHASRVEFKRKAGNDAFKSAEYQQAAVYYTEALAIEAAAPEGAEGRDPTVVALHSNRAACFLKLGRYAQAREDAEAVISRDDTFAKGHFRLGLALQAEERFDEACAAFNRVLSLEPKNKEAAQGLRMAEVQAVRQRRQNAA